MPNPTRISLVVSTSFALCVAFAAGCSSDSHPERPENTAIVVPDYPPTMTGRDNFANGKLLVEVSLGMPTNFHAGKEGKAGGGGGNHGGGGGGHHGGGHHGGGGMGSGGYPGVDGSGESDSGGSSDEDTPRPVVMGSTLPPAQLKLHLENTSATEALSCEVMDFNSNLGNDDLPLGRGWRRHSRHRGPSNSRPSGDKGDYTAPHPGTGKISGAGAGADTGEVSSDCPPKQSGFRIPLMPPESTDHSSSNRRTRIAKPTTMALLVACS